MAPYLTLLSYGAVRDAMFHERDCMRNVLKWSVKLAALLKKTGQKDQSLIRTNRQIAVAEEPPGHG